MNCIEKQVYFDKLTEVCDLLIWHRGMTAICA